jgi:hypothetical protein
MIVISTAWGKNHQIHRRENAYQVQSDKKKHCCNYDITHAVNPSSYVMNPYTDTHTINSTCTRDMSATTNLCPSTVPAFNDFNHCKLYILQFRFLRHAQYIPLFYLFCYVFSAITLRVHILFVPCIPVYHMIMRNLGKTAWQESLCIHWPLYIFSKISRNNVINMLKMPENGLYDQNM